MSQFDSTYIATLILECVEDISASEFATALSCDDGRLCRFKVLISATDPIVMFRPSEILVSHHRRALRGAGHHNNICVNAPLHILIRLNTGLCRIGETSTNSKTS